MNIFESLKNRQSTRAFFKRPVDTTLVLEIIQQATYAPSSTNIQPWQVALVSGDKKQELCQKLEQAFLNDVPRTSDYQVYPENWIEPYRSRRKACGLAMYSALNIQREDRERQKQQWLANYHGFGAPCLLFFFIDPTLPHYSLLDYGMFLQSIMLGLTANGLASCTQASLAEYPDIIKSELNYKNQRLICGMSVGYKDPDHPINQYRTERTTIDTFVTQFK